MRDLFEKQDQNYVILYYTHSCKGCKETIEVFERVAKHFESNKFISFAKINLAKNEVEVQVSVPNLVFFPNQSY